MRGELESYVKSHPSDISEHLLYIYDKCIEVGAKRVVEIGVRGGESTRAILYALSITGGSLTAIDKKKSPSTIDEMNFTFLLCDSRKACIANENIDLLMIDSGHTFDLTLEELERFGIKVRKGGYILLHDTISSKEDVKVLEAIQEYIKRHKGEFHFTNRENNNGLGVLKRIEDSSL